MDLEAIKRMLLVKYPAFSGIVLNTQFIEREEVITAATDGEVVYYNPVTNTKCNSSEAVSTTGTKEGCMRWYAFLDDVDSSIKLLLDHNISGKVSWANTGDNSSGPVTLLPYLKEATANWVGTETPTNYSLSQTTGGNYTISYEDEGYKARLITVNEVLL